jgi:hypothetical protein
MTKEVLDQDKKVADLTIGEFFEAISHKEAIDRLQKMEKALEEKARSLHALEESSRTIFENAKGLTQATTPFEIKSKDELKKFIKMCEGIFETATEETTIVVAIALKSKNQFRAM